VTGVVASFCCALHLDRAAVGCACLLCVMAYDVTTGTQRRKCMRIIQIELESDGQGAVLCMSLCFSDIGLLLGFRSGVY
jgi:hypothetical protein